MKKAMVFFVTLLAIMLLAGCSDKVGLNGNVGVSMNVVTGVKALGYEGGDWSSSNIKYFDIEITDESSSAVSWCSLSEVDDSTGKRVFKKADVAKDSLASLGLVMSQGNWTFTLKAYDDTSSNSDRQLLATGTTTKLISVVDKSVSITLIPSSTNSRTTHFKVKIGTSSNPVKTLKSNDDVSKVRLALFIDDMTLSDEPAEKFTATLSDKYHTFSGEYAATVNNRSSSMHYVTVAYQVKDGSSSWKTSRGRTFALSVFEGMVFTIKGELDEENYQDITITYGTYELTFAALSVTDADKITRGDVVVKKGDSTLTETTNYTVEYTWLASASNTYEMSESSKAITFTTSQGNGKYTVSCTAVVSVDGTEIPITQSTEVRWVNNALTAL